MAFIDWTSDLSVEVSIIDEQHKELVRLINELADAMGQGQAKESMMDIISGLGKYTVTHFNTEEMYFRKFSYVNEADHKKEHDDFVSKIHGFEREIQEGNTKLSFEVLKFLKDWLMKHIKGTDKKYISCFHENGVQ